MMGERSLVAGAGFKQPQGGRKCGIMLVRGVLKFNFNMKIEAVRSPFRINSRKKRRCEWDDGTKIEHIREKPVVGSYRRRHKEHK